VTAYAATTCPRLTGSKVLPVRGLLTSLECALPGTLCCRQRWMSAREPKVSVTALRRALAPSITNWSYPDSVDGDELWKSALAE
jgi:hypothetical protein